MSVERIMNLGFSKEVAEEILVEATCNIEETLKYNHKPWEFLLGAFIWEKSKKGHSYWSSVSKDMGWLQNAT